MLDRRGPLCQSTLLLAGARWWQTMRADEYLRLRVACIAMVEQSHGLDVQARWAKLADAASVAAEGALVVVGNRSVLNIQS
jgi:hypothetical protein